MNNMGPTLVEPGMKYYVTETLKKCNKFKNNYYNLIINIILFLIFILAISSFLYTKYNYHNNKELKLKKKKEEEEYMHNLIYNIQTKRRKENGSKITDLPDFENEYEKTMKKFM